MIFKIKILFVTMVCALSIIGCKGTDKICGAKWAIEKKPIEKGDIKFDIKDEKFVLGPNWKKATEGVELDLAHAKNVLTVYYVASTHDKDGSGDEDPNSHCKRLVIPYPGGTLTFTFPPGCK